MNILSRYVAGKFFRPFFAGLGIFALLIFAADLFDRMHHLLKSKADLGIIIEYLCLEIPYWTVRVVPMATLLASLLCVISLTQSGEWIAVQAAGFAAFPVFRPILYCAVAVAGVSFLAQETVLPAAHARAGRIWRDSIHPEWEWDKYYDIAILAKPREFLEARLFLPKAGRLERVILERWDPERGVVYQLDAQRALWDGAAARWVFYNGVERRFSAGKPEIKPFSRLVSELDVEPKRMIPRPQNPDDMTYREIRRHAAEARGLGAQPRALLTAAQAKLAYPFANLVLAALGIPLALRLRKSAKILGFCAALAVSFLYIWCLEIGKALGNSGAAPPWLAAWAAHAVFGAAAGLFLARTSDARP